MDPARQRSPRLAELARAATTACLHILREGFRDIDPLVREHALVLLDRLGALLTEDLVLALRDPSPRLRRRAVELCVNRPELDIAPLLLDPDPLVAEATAFVLGERQDRFAVPDLCDLADHSPNLLVREAAIAALGAIGDQRALDTIIRASSHPKAVIRRRAIVALAAFEGPAVEETLQRARLDRDWQVRQAAEDLCGRVKDL